jgi:sugar (pentulose or hexulose) kinase
MGRAIFFQEWADPTLASRVRHILTYPQYWTWRLSGALASEISFLGCHSHMWNPLAGRFSSLAVSRGWAEKFPPLVPAGALVGEREGLGIHNGVHDSNAAFYYYKSLGFSDFTLISTGTWVIIFNPDCPLDRLDAARDMLANVTVDGAPVATIRFMGGREYDVISGQARQEVSEDALRAAIARDQMALPSFAAGGPFPARAGRLVGPAPESAAERAAIATLYVAAMTAKSLDLVSSSRDIILDGGLAHNVALCATLAALRPGQSLYRNTDAEGTAMGAAALAFRALGRNSVFRREIDKVEPWAPPGLADYYARWQERA